MKGFTVYKLFYTTKEKQETEKNYLINVSLKLRTAMENGNTESSLSLGMIYIFIHFIY